MPCIYRTALGRLRVLSAYYQGPSFEDNNNIMMLPLSNPFSLRNLLTLLLTISSSSIFVLSAPTSPNAIDTNANYDVEQREAVPYPRYQEDQNDMLKRSAGLYWGPHKVGNLRLSLTNPHPGYAGPKFPDATHVNFHVDKQDPRPRGTYSEVVNLHIVKYENVEGSQCLYAWDSVTDTVVFDSCFDDFTDAIPEAVGAIKDFVYDLLKEADFIAGVIIIGALVVALAACLASLGAVAVA